MRNLIILSLSLLLCSTGIFAAEQSSYANQEWLNQFHTFITNPNIAYLFLLIAIYGIFFELANPGMIVPGFIGLVSLLIVMYAFHLMPINYLGVMLILFGIGFMIAEIYVMTFGLIGLGGVIAFIIGSIFLFDTTDPTYQLAWPLIVTMSVISFTFIFIIISLAIKSHKKKIVSGREGLIGKEGVILSVMNRQIVVRVMGEIWEARSSHMLNEGDRISVTDINGLMLTVEPIEEKRGK